MKRVHDNPLSPWLEPARAALVTTVSFLLTATVAWSGNSERIRVNQVGYAVGQPKLAISLDSNSQGSLIDSSTGSTVFQGTLGAASVWTDAMDTARIFNFSKFETPGTYFVQIGSNQSHPVHISANPFRQVSRGSVKAYWFNRCSYAPASPYADPWVRDAGHPDTAVLVHASAATAQRPTNTKIRSPRGWYDAGDFGKYVVNSGISTWTLLHLYERKSAYFDTLHLNVPGHGGPASDLVDEILWNLRWMLSMQDPNDGGVYHKLSTANFAPLEMPSKDKAARYVVQKSTQAALDLAATAASAARIFRGNTALPGFSDTCLSVALGAWKWARQHPDSLYDQDSVNAYYSPAINTGTYSDATTADEFQWAAAELFLTTQADSFSTALGLPAKISAATSWTWPGWGDVGSLGWISLLDHPSLLTGSLASSGAALKSGLLATANPIRTYRARNSYHLPQAGFWWGSNAVFANNGMLLWEAWEASGDTGYRTASLEALDYLMGRNATGYSFVTGFGDKTPVYPHHGASSDDGIAAPVPGFLVGGPNPGQEDGCTYPSSLGPKSYIDKLGCYASDEVCINWNAPFAYLAGVWSAQLDSLSGTPNSVHSGARPSGWLSTTASRGIVTANLGGQPISRLELLDASGRLLAKADGPATTLSARIDSKGLVFVQVRGLDGSRHATALELP
jgi:endoglucanase